MRAAEQAKAPGRGGLAEAVAKNLYKLMAYKDEYEVARLYADGAFRAQADAAFDGELRFEFHLAPPLLARRNETTGEPRKITLGPWMMKGFSLLAKLKGLRGTAFDVFGYTDERRTERALIADYERTVGELIAKLDPANHALAVAIASVPEKIRGFGHVKLRHLEAAKAEEKDLLARFRNPPASTAVAAE